MDAIKQIVMVVEGVNAIPASVKLSEKYQVEMSIISAVSDIVNNIINPRDAVEIY